MTRQAFLSPLLIAACSLGSSATAQDSSSGAVPQAAVAESIVAREEAESGRVFDPAFRVRAVAWLEALPMVALVQGQTGEDGLGLNALGDSQADLVYTPVTPCRIIDTRLGGGALAAGTARSFLVTGSDYSAQGGSATGCGVPFGPTTAAAVNFVAVDPGGAGNLSLTPFGRPMPLAAIINFRAGVNLANGLVVATCDPATATCGSDITIQANNSAAHLVADVQGYFQRVSAGGVGTALLADNAVTAPKIGTGVVVRSLNGQTDAVTLAGGNGLGVTQESGTVTVASNATPASTAGAIVSRDGTGSFSAGTVVLAGSLDLPSTAAASVGVVTKGGMPFLHSFGTENTFVGTNTGNFTLTGGYNSAVGGSALVSNTGGHENAAFGFWALRDNTTGHFNAAVGTAALLKNTTGYSNTAVGWSALHENTTGNENTAFGSLALQSNTTADSNSAFGQGALRSNTTGSYNSAFGNAALTSSTTASASSAFGNQALYSNTTGIGNSAVGDRALWGNTTGSHNSAFGEQALVDNTTGSYNSAVGSDALTNSTTGYNNSAFGTAALKDNTTGYSNSAFGVGALAANTEGPDNAAFGNGVLAANTIGGHNSAFGGYALSQLASGEDNIALGYNSGSNLTAGSANLYLGSPGGSTAESGTIRIGSSFSHTATYIAGISGATSASGLGVYIDSDGKLGTVTSSRLYKEGIEDMGAESDVLLRLRAVSFYYRPELDATHLRQYGLVAEEVAEVAPDLVAYDRDGTPQTVRYHFVNAMLLNEVQRQRRLVEDERRANEEQGAVIRELVARLARLEAALAGDR